MKRRSERGKMAVNVLNQKEGDNVKQIQKTKISNEDAEQVVKEVRKRGSKSASVEANLTATKPELQQMFSNVLYWYKRDIVHSDEECADRLNEFFQRIKQTGEIPTVEKMCLSLGTVRSVVWEWENGSKGNARANMIKKAKEILAALDAELVSNNKIPQVTYIFRAKNFYQMADKSEVVLTPNNPLDQMDASQARQKLMDAIPSEQDE